jgi:hypothetical protein
LSSAISVMIGPVGWVALGLSAIIKLGGPNYKKNNTGNICDCNGACRSSRSAQNSAHSNGQYLYG